MGFLIGFLRVCGLVVFVLGCQALVFLPVTLVYELWKRNSLRRLQGKALPSVSVLVPAFNEERTLARSLESILASDYPSFEIIVVNDGSDDETEERVTPFLKHPGILYLRKENGGKASALNLGLQHAGGEIIVFTDADSIFQKDTLLKLARWFVNPQVHAVCGDDTPLLPSTALQKLLTITTHIGTGFVRRAFSVLGIIPVISGNCGAVRRELLLAVGGFRNVWGEDLDLTFKLQKVGAKIIYDWEALVHCEVPATIRALWRQRVRWVRSYLQISRFHSDLLFKWKYAPFSFYLPVNWFNLIVLPVTQTAMLLALPAGLMNRLYVFDNVVDFLLFSGYLFFLILGAYSILLDRRPDHLRYLPLYGALVLPFSLVLNGVVVYSIYQEIRDSREVWFKSERRDLSRQMPSLYSRAGWAYSASAFLSVVGLVSLFLVINPHDTEYHASPEVHPGLSQLTVATHFDAWAKPEEAIRSVLDRPGAGAIGTVGVEAGRYEWNFFRWAGHEGTWSNDQKHAAEDLVLDAIRQSHMAGKGVIAIVDLFAPRYIEEHPEAAAVSSDGQRSTEQVCFTELVNGAYGQHLREMVGYLARNYPLEGISVTELDYYRFCYDDRCLALWRSDVKSDDWPRSFFTGNVERKSKRLGEWRSGEMARFLRMMADSAHAYGKKFYVDVPIDFNNLNTEGLYHGLLYPQILKFADGLIVWDYFYLEGRSPASSEDVAAFFTKKYGADRVIFSFGLWGKGQKVGPEELSSAVQHSLSGGALKLWITPNHLLGEKHWEILVQTLNRWSHPPQQEFH